MGDAGWRSVDNGAGMDEEQLKTAEGWYHRNADGPQKHRRGKCNKRIRLYYGEEFGLTIESRLGEGTVIRFCIPGIHREGMT